MSVFKNYDTFRLLLESSKIFVDEGFYELPQEYQMQLMVNELPLFASAEKAFIPAAKKMMDLLDDEYENRNPGEKRIFLTTLLRPLSQNAVGILNNPGPAYSTMFTMYKSFSSYMLNRDKRGLNGHNQLMVWSVTQNHGPRDFTNPTVSKLSHKTENIFLRIIAEFNNAPQSERLSPVLVRWVEARNSLNV